MQLYIIKIRRGMLMQDDFKLLSMEYCLTIKRMNKIYEEKIQGINAEIENIYAYDWKKQYFHSVINSFANEIVDMFAKTLKVPDCISVSQLYKRIETFSYENEYDPLYKKVVIRKCVDEDVVKDVNCESNKIRIKLKRGIFHNDKKMALNQYYDTHINEGMDYVIDELTGEMRIRRDIIDNRSIPIAVLAGDHKIPIAEAGLNKRYTKEIKRMVDELDHIYNDRDNIWYIGAKTNNFKSDAATYEEAIEKIERGARNNPDSLSLLIEEGTVDEQGKVKPEVVQKLKKEYEQGRCLVEIKTDKAQLRNINYEVIFRDAKNKMFRNLKLTKNTISKALFPQLAYYTIPPIVYELRVAISTETNLTNIVKKLNESGVRVINYVVSKTKNIVGGVAINIIKDFISIVFDIVVSLLRSFYKDIINVGRKIVISMIESITILLRGNGTKNEKLDAICKLMSMTISNCVIELVFNKLKSVGLPDSCADFLQIVCSVLISNLVFVILEDWDLFNVRLGFNVEKVNELFIQYEIGLRNELQDTISDFNNNADCFLLDMRSLIDEMNEKLNSEDDFIADSIINTSKKFGSRIDYENKVSLFMGDVD